MHCLGRVRSSLPSYDPQLQPLRERVTRVVAVIVEDDDQSSTSSRPICRASRPASASGPRLRMISFVSRTHCRFLFHGRNLTPKAGMAEASSRELVPAQEW
jgi:hypothetical protein